ncbi:MAG: FAD-binding oxidoreductase [Crenarchaeota archaeon]|nr:MAG: FAD-binding oxidoreductase [Thermoproteota archaeon]RDJ34043.1 MAG: FAD-binding oxidoreductase [Thermoproteota archaeon]RDJ36843.1 MAG: FAD-binding oxidoreductase [Thermoproteota archaeon]RDJ37623.1 MAG: FAD-binding oxidoreductase [Thermoproteota archaeon]
MNSKLLKLKLSKIIKGEIFTQKEVLAFYSVDSSSYQVFPRIVVIPKDRKDVISIVKFAVKNKIPIVPRGAGTGLVGSALGSGIILDMRNFSKFSLSRNYVTLEPGVQKGILDKALSSKGKIFGPNPSVGSYCAIGGMIGNNSSGSRSLRYGAIIDNLLEITIVNGEGKVIKFPTKSKTTQKILSLAKRINKEKFPKVTKNSCGYRLDRITNLDDVPKIIAGSEGTLGVILSAKLKIYDKPKKRILYLLEYKSALDALNDCHYIVKSNPVALEYVDKNTIESIPEKFSKNIGAMLFLEYDSNNKYQFKTQHIHGKVFKKITKDKEINTWWKYRDSSLAYSLKKISKKERSFHIIEDGTVPVKELRVILETIHQIEKKYKCRSIIYGHAGNGNLHVRLIMKNQSAQTIRSIAQHYFKRIISVRGSITGEHGDGLARSEFVRKQYGNQNYTIFKILKKEFDPHNILNPGKKITSKPMTENLIIDSGLKSSTITK